MDFATADGTAVAGIDYAATSGTLTFAPGETLQTVPVTIFGDLDPESEEVFLVTLSNPSGVILGDAQALASIRDEESCASINLLANGDAEDGVPVDPAPGWQETESGWRQRFADPTPLSGTAAFGYGGGADPAELSRTLTCPPSRR